MNVREADFVIVGAGSAGCVLAMRLSEDPACRVLLLEAGGEDESPTVMRPSDWPLLYDRGENWGYATVKQAGYNFRIIDCPRGKVLGGSSSTNAMIYIRGDPADYDHWAKAGNRGWAWKDVLPFFLMAEKQERGASRLHGVGGPLEVTDSPDLHRLSSDFIESAVSVGHARNPDFNGESLAGAGPYQRTIASGIRCSTARAYLRPVRSRPNLAVLTHSQVTRLKISGGQCSGVEFYRDGRVESAGAACEVILSAGAIDSPRLLQLSGIGDPEHLRSVGVEVKAALLAVGENLHDHPTVSVVHAAHRASAVAAHSNHAEAGLFLKGPKPNGGYQADVQFHFSACGPPSAAARGLARGPSLTANICRPHSRGRLRVRSAHPFAAPLIDPGYLTDRRDLELQIEGLRAAREIFAARPLADACAGELSPGSMLRTDGELERAIRSTGDCIFHPVGTCRMGNDALSVVDNELRVHGIKGLRVIDASVMPQVTSGNINAPTIMIAEKAADLIAARFGARRASSHGESEWSRQTGTVRA